MEQKQPDVAEVPVQVVVVTPPMTKWILTVLSIILSCLSIAVMVMGFSISHVGMVFYGISGVLVLILAVLTLIGIYVPQPIVTVVAYYLCGFLFFFNLGILVALVVMLIMGTSLPSGRYFEGQEMRIKVVTVADMLVCLVIEALLIPTALLLHHYASKHQNQTIAYSPIELVKCSCCKKSDPAAASPDV